MARVLGVLGIPYAISFQGLSGADLPVWVKLLPTAIMIIALPVGAIVGGIRSRDVRALALRTGMTVFRELETTVAQQATLFPFDSRRRRSADGVVGWHSGRPRLRFVHGARVMVHATRLDRPLPPLQLLPRRPDVVLDAGGGEVLPIGAEWFDSAWRIVAPSSRYAHAVLVPTVLESLEPLRGRRPVIAIEGWWIWSVDPVHRMAPERSLERFEALERIAERIPGFVRGDDAGGTLDQASSFFHGYRTENSVGRIALVLGASLVAAPVGLLVAFLARRAVRRGAADNRKTVEWAFWLSLVGTVLWVGFVAGATAGWL
ncbi:hypothetical protein [Demequina zhanjiangensis]|uniref:ABC transporter permease n=1 Tax=Demequina zhanjiangensis TaxID=3051659 RepID=A0ABT8G3H1_9MICO|nr:hypothetical protein [Demequina sp. SYSU T00b26]MDN4473691.1 hypothetical protein [Demequina sp. SYSU T00b26]